MEYEVELNRVKELCEYEKLRARNMKEIEKAMAETNFFENLREYKNEIGLQNNAEDRGREEK